VTESTVIKRLFLTESESSSNFSTQAIQNLCNDKSGNDAEKYEECLNKIGDMKQSLREKTDILNSKTKLLEQVFRKINIPLYVHFKILKLNFFTFFIKARVKNKRFRRTEFRLKEKTFRQSTPNGLDRKSVV